jgi:hypothetical protein
MNISFSISQIIIINVSLKNLQTQLKKEEKKQMETENNMYKVQNF